MRFGWLEAPNFAQNDAFRFSCQYGSFDDGRCDFNFCLLLACAYHHDSYAFHDYSHHLHLWHSLRFAFVSSSSADLLRVSQRSTPSTFIGKDQG